MGLCVLAALRPSVCGARKDRCRLGRQMVALGLLGRSWCARRELRTECFGGTPGRCAGARWDGEALGKSISAISALIAAYTVAFRTLVGWGAANSSRSCACGRVRWGRKGWTSWRCDGLKSS